MVFPAPLGPPMMMTTGAVMLNQSFFSAATSASICANSCAADIWIRSRAVPSGTTG